MSVLKTRRGVLVSRLGLGAAAAVCAAVVLPMTGAARPADVLAVETADAQDDGPWRKLAFPAGEYRSLVFGNGSNSTNAVVELTTPSGVFPIVVGPGRTVQLEFADSLRVGRSNEVWLDATPSRFASKSEVIRSGFVSAFGIGPSGLVPLVPVR